jgi:glucose-6-phosphate dehydrogenase assembly protein OpcA
VAVHAHLDHWEGEDVSVSQVERELARLRQAGESTDMRTSVMTHMAWVPPEWVEAATRTLEGLEERYPSRTIMLLPNPDGPDQIDAELSLECFPLETTERHVCSEVIKLRLGGARAAAPASIVQPLLIADLPAFLRWRGRPPFGDGVFEQLLEVVDRLVVDSSEWPDVPEAYRVLAEVFDRVAVSDIAWGRSLEWRRTLAGLWPEIAGVSELRVAAPLADASLLAGWLRSKLRRTVKLVHDEADQIELVAVDGEAARLSHDDDRTPSDLLSEELDNFVRDPVYEEAARAASTSS